MRLTLTLALLLTTALAAPPAPSVATAFDHFYNLDYDEAVAEFRQLLALDPQSPEAWNHLAQGLFYDSLFNAGMMGSDLLKSNQAIITSRRLKLSPERNAEILHAIDQAQALAETRLAKHPNDVEALYQLGVSYELRANHDLTVRHNWVVGLADANRSRELHQQVMQLNPKNVDARLIPGVHEYMIGTLPLIVVLAARAAGFNGDRDQGLRMIEDVAHNGRTAQVDARILLPVLYRREKRSGDGLPWMRDLIRAYPRNFLMRIEYSKLLLDSGDRSGAARELDQIDRLIDQKAPGYGPSRVEMIRQHEAEIRKRLKKS